ncbi:permease [Escherichia coli]|uniref:hypothetical protein n=1 Tax=Escherichia coli TaxID=562 RepID=UPI0005443008|nr:hypothetical protein [Escherichia coli]EEU9452376.1 permease [Escherichia coli]KHJ14842.1 hypothetical protein PU06_23755 [Escherichia coli]MBC0413823.1 permease [Escherichia coli]MCT6297361.1 permease [Escherichia coli]HDD9729502.1 permease [Escherichia coli]
MYIREAIQNIIENKKIIMVILIFFIVGFSGIAVTDSLIYSTSKKAEMELTLSGRNIITVDFNTKVSEKKIDSIFYNDSYIISKSKKNIFNVGKSPFENEIKMVLGTDDISIYNRSIEMPFLFKGDVVFVSGEECNCGNESIFFNGLPFKIIGEINNKKTEFLDSLGLSSFKNKVNYIIPIETMFRLTLDDTIDSINIVKRGEVNYNDIVKIKEALMNNDVIDFTVHSILDAKKAVENVLSRFTILTNTVYILLNVMMLVIIITVCRRAFQDRGVEFALKVIHGIDKRIIIHTVIVEMMLITLTGVFISMILTTIIMYFLSLYVGIEMFFRPVMIMLSLLLVILASYVVGIHSGASFFKQNPVNLIKNRKQ